MNWGAVALGAMGGLGLALIVVFVFGTTGLADFFAGAALLIFLQYSAQVAAGYLAGRLTATGRVVHGGLAGMTMAGIGSVIGLSANPTDIRLPLVILGLAIAATSGSAGGALAEYQVRQAAEQSARP